MNTWRETLNQPRPINTVEEWEQQLAEMPDPPSMFENWRVWLVLAACAGLEIGLIYYTWDMWGW